MAYIRTIKRKKGTIYKAEVRIKGHDPLYQTFDCLSDAQRWTEDTEATLRSGGYIGDAAPGDMAFDKALNRHELEVSNKKRPNTQAREITSATKLRKSFSGLSL